MKKIALGMLFILGSLSVNAQKMTAEEIIAKCVETMGGKAAWMKVKGQYMKAVGTAQGMEFPIDMYELKDGRQITKFSIQGMEMTQGAFDGETLWSTSFMTMKAEKSDAEDTENMKRSIGEFPSPLVTYEDMGYTVTLEEDDVKEGVECYKIRMDKKTQLVEGAEVPDVQYYFIDKENFVPVCVEEEISGGPMKGQMSVTILGDYQEVDGLYFPFSIKQGAGMQAFELTVEEIQLNPEVEDAIFAFPEEGK
jgi:hypothetical protein